MYDAHLQVVHASISTERKDEEKRSSDGEGGVSYASFGGPATGVVASRAEEAQVTKRVGALPGCEVHCSTLIVDCF